jgi:hypothetical protein
MQYLKNRFLIFGIQLQSVYDFMYRLDVILQTFVEFLKIFNNEINPHCEWFLVMIGVF